MAVVGAVAAVFTAYTQYTAAQDAKDSANAAAEKEEQMAAQQAANIEAETAESVRRAKAQAAKAEGESRARAAASGAVGGSLDIALDAMAEEHDRQIAWMGKTGKANARMAIMGGGMAADAQRSRADAFNAQKWGAVASGVANTYSAGSDAGWWGGTTA